MKPNWIAVSVTAVIGIILIANGGWLAIAMIWNYAFGPKAPPILRDARQSGGASFDTIIRKHFPPGTSATAMVAELTAQGFRSPETPDTSCRVLPGKFEDLRPDCPTWDTKWNPANQLEYRWTSGPCGVTLNIRWSADKTGQLKNAEGSEYEVCL